MSGAAEFQRLWPERSDFAALVCRRTPEPGDWTENVLHRCVAPPDMSAGRRLEWLWGRRVALWALDAVGATEAAIGMAADGRPQVLGVQSGWVLSISHSKTVAAAIVSMNPCGIDVCNHVDGLRVQRLAQRIAGDAEHSLIAHWSGLHSEQLQRTSFSRWWAAKEAGLKLVGQPAFGEALQSMQIAVAGAHWTYLDGGRELLHSEYCDAQVVVASSVAQK